METYEKDILKREITNEVREDLTRAAGKLITRRVLLALAVIMMELLLWAFITASVVKDASIGMGLTTCFMVCALRLLQVSLICWFNEK